MPFRDPPCWPRAVVACAVVVLATLAMLAIIHGVTVLLIASGAKAEEDNCRGFIPSHCCCSNLCCFEIAATDLDMLPGMQARVRASGQVIKAEWSRDGKYYRCACDQSESGEWVKHPAAHTRCLFIPQPSS